MDYQNKLQLLKVLLPKTSRECACYAAYLPKNTLWKGTDGNMKKELTVYFFEDTDNVLENLHYNYNPLTPEVIMKIVQNNWKIEDEHREICSKILFVLSYL